MTFVNASHNLSNKEIERFSRQLILKGFGPSSMYILRFTCITNNILTKSNHFYGYPGYVSLLDQERLKNSSCLVVGAGGLGCPLSIYLAAAGIGRLGIIGMDSS